MSEDFIVRHGAPALAGIKTGNLFPAEYEERSALMEEVRSYNRMLRRKGLRLLVLKTEGHRALIYLYRPNSLARDLESPEAAAILHRCGYRDLRPSACLAELIRRLRREREFPHEIGLFLDYPPEDVLGFMEHRKEGCKLVGTWKVYGDAVAARRMFAVYKKCTDRMCARCGSGATLASLASAV